MLYISSCAVLRDEFDKFIRTGVDVMTHVLCRWLRRPLFTIENARAVRIKSPLEGGVRVCGDAVLRYFWCGFAVIFILTRGIAVSKH